MPGCLQRMLRVSISSGIKIWPLGRGIIEKGPGGGVSGYKKLSVVVCMMNGVHAIRFVARRASSHKVMNGRRLGVVGCARTG